mmetsp:Transcript_30539/g.87246  ORF Transcript_30539/g.87246 Transcript_30539/m.87246 type:complete len:263 (-) Transcript_30539:315-1103(-)
MMLLPRNGGRRLSCGARAVGDLALDFGLQGPHGLVPKARRQGLRVAPQAVEVGPQAPELQLRVDLLLVDPALDGAHRALELLEPRRRSGVARRQEALHVLVHALPVLVLLAQGPLVLLNAGGGVAETHGDLLDLLQNLAHLRIALQLLRPPLGLRLGHGGAEVGALLTELEVQAALGDENAVHAPVLGHEALLGGDEAGLERGHPVVEARGHVLELVLDLLPVRVALALQARHELRDPVRQLSDLLVDQWHRGTISSLRLGK